MQLAHAEPKRVLQSGMSCARGEGLATIEADVYANAQSEAAGALESNQEDNRAVFHCTANHAD